MLLLAWNQGYKVFFLASAAALALGFCIGTLLDLAIMRSPHMHTFFIVGRLLPVKGILMPHLPILASALVLSVVWDLGYAVWSFESCIALALGLFIGMLLELVAMHSPRMRALFSMLLFVCMLDIFFLSEVFWVHIAVALSIFLALSIYKKIPINVPVFIGVIFALSLPFSEKAKNGISPVDTPVSNSTENGLLIHLVLDELGAFDSVPLDDEKLKDVQYVSAQYAERGFIIYPNIMSVSPDTQLSMGTLMDLSFLHNVGGNVQKIEGRNGYRIVSSPLQNRFKTEGWGVTVVQPEYVDYCRSGFSCYTYSWGSSSAFSTIPDLWLRAKVLVREFLSALISDSRSLEFAKLFYNQIADEVLPKDGWRNPTLPFVAMSQLRQLEKSLINAKGRHYVFAHILVPHFPWVYDKKCRVNSVDNWVLPYAGRSNSQQGARQRATDAYWAQSMCIHKTVLEFIDTMDVAHPGRTRFVIHGDHGPRTMARRVLASSKPEQDEQTRKNLQSPFVATRIVSDRIKQPPVNKVLQNLLSGLLSEEAKVMKAGVQK